jgi:hypothetical protein
MFLCIINHAKLSGNMIDRIKFDENFQYYDKEDIGELADLFDLQQPEIIGLLDIDVATHNLVGIKLHAHKLLGPMAMFYDPVASAHARQMEDAAMRKIFDIIDSFSSAYPDVILKLRREFDDYDLFLKHLVPAGSLTVFFSRAVANFSSQHALKLAEIEEDFTQKHMVPMLEELRVSSAALRLELLAMKNELT